MFLTYSKSLFSMDTSTESNLVIDDDSQCREILVGLRSDLSDENEQLLITVCLGVLDAEIGDEIPYGPDQMMGLVLMASSHPELREKIYAVMSYLSMTMEMEMDNGEENGTIFNYALHMFEQLQQEKIENLANILMSSNV